jgi:hypothetical protein
MWNGNYLVLHITPFCWYVQQPYKNQLTNPIKIEDVDPEVFDLVLHFICKGRLTATMMEAIAARLYIAAEKY